MNLGCGHLKTHPFISYRIEQRNREAEESRIRAGEHQMRTAESRGEQRIAADTDESSLASLLASFPWSALFSRLHTACRRFIDITTAARVLALGITTLLII
eukprot:15052514-Heterocapsa_arctica.AAC.1